MEVHVPWKSLDTVATPRNGCLAEQMLGRDSATNALDARLRLLDIRDTFTSTARNMSEQSSETVSNNDAAATAGKDQAGFSVELIEDKDVPEVLGLLKEFFFKDEPMNKYLDMDDDCKELEDYSTKSIVDNCSFKAVNVEGKIVGVLLNGIVKKPPPDASPVSYADACPHEKFKKILKLMEYIDTQFDLFQLYPDIDRYMDGKIMAVDEKYRGYGIGGILTERTTEYMRANNIGIYAMMCSSYYSARVCEKQNFQRVYTLNFVDYVVNGENPILPAAPHTAIQIFAREVK